MKSKKGFTLVEMLIVVAIIAILVGISIPVVNAQQEKAKEAVDLANVRAAYTKVMMSAMGHDTNPESYGVTYIHDRWYIDVELTQGTFDWQTAGPFNVGGIDSSDKHHWVGTPAPGGHCLVSYTEADGAVIAWEYNFAQIMNSIIIDSGSYKGLSITDLIKVKRFTMVESSGSTGEMITSELKHQLGMNNSSEFSYKILPAKDYYSDCGPDDYLIFISEDYTLKTGLKKNLNDCGRTINVTGYIYHIDSDGASTLKKKGTVQQLSTYTNKNGQEKIDAFGNQDNCVDIPVKADHVAYVWD